MAIEIKELHIKATVVDTKNNTREGDSLSKRDIEKLKREITATCVQEVMQILNTKMER